MTTTNDTCESSIKKGFEMLGITEEQYPDYSDPTSFAEGFQICSLFSENEAVLNDAVIMLNKH